MNRLFATWMMSMFFIPSLMLGGIDVSSVTVEIDPIKQTLDVNLPQVYILPDSPLYQVKLMWEQVKMFLSQTQQQQIELCIQLANVRLSETLALLDQNKIDLATKTYGEYLQLSNRSEQLWDDSKESLTKPTGEETTSGDQFLVTQTKVGIQREIKQLANVLMGEYKIKWTK